MKIGITFFASDLIDPNNLIKLKKIKKYCDYLIVGFKLNLPIERSNTNAHSQTTIQKYICLNKSKYVDEIIPYVSDQDVEDILHSFKIDLMVVESKFKNIDFIGKEYCSRKEIEVLNI